jgi:hypothetical protein
MKASRARTCLKYLISLKPLTPLTAIKEIKGFKETTIYSHVRTYARSNEVAI